MYASRFKFEILKTLVIHNLFLETPNDDRGEKLTINKQCHLDKKQIWAKSIPSRISIVQSTGETALQIICAELVLHLKKKKKKV